MATRRQTVSLSTGSPRAVAPVSPVASPRFMNKKEAVADFNAKIKNLIEVYYSINSLSARLYKEGPGAKLRIASSDGQFYELERKNIKTAQAQFVEALKGLKKDFNTGIKNSGKKGKKASQPITVDSLKSVYAPVVVHSPMKEFFGSDPSMFGYVNPDDPKSGLLVKHLELLTKYGYALRNTITTLFWIYVYHNSLQNKEHGSVFMPDEYMDTFFGEEYAHYYVEKGEDSNGKKIRTQKLPQTLAVDKGIIENRYTSYELAALTHVDGAKAWDARDDGYRSITFYQVFAGFNYGTMDDIQKYEPEKFDQHERFIQQNAPRLLSEHNMVAQTSEYWNQKNAPIKKERAKLRRDQEKSRAKTTA